MGCRIGATVYAGLSVIEAQPTSSLATALITGAAIGFVVVFSIVCAALLLAGAGVGLTLGVGVFVAMFGGPGFGTMFGANWYVHRNGDSI
jgi:hypothetical protein